MKSLMFFVLCMISTIMFAQDQIINGSLSIGNHIDMNEGEGYRLHLRGTKNNSDHLWMSKYVRGLDLTDLRVNIGDYNNGDRLAVGTQSSPTDWTEFFVVSSLDSGRVGIGVPFPQNALDVRGVIKSDKLIVAGDIDARSVNITISAGADFVFESSYSLKPLSEVETFVKKNKHLPDIPSEKEMQENGINVNDMQIKLLQKIEELTLYVIELNKENKELKKEVEQLKAK